MMATMYPQEMKVRKPVFEKVEQQLTWMKVYFTGLRLALMSLGFGLDLFVYEPFLFFCWAYSWPKSLQTLVCILVRVFGSWSWLGHLYSVLGQDLSVGLGLGFVDSSFLYRGPSRSFGLNMGLEHLTFSHN